jgi:tRNA threonylcarbamoyladenosine biosynthesis protein TsaE
MSTCSWTTVTEGPEATAALAARLGSWMRPGQGLALTGELGAGKTVFVRGLARGLRVDEPDEVRSPTYLMMVEHPGPVPLVHVDAYFRDKGVRLHEEGGLMAFDPRAVVAVEWPERLASGIPADWLRVRIEVISETARELTLSGVVTPWAALLARCGLAV